jgi:superfamily II DNA helicase RecQ
MQNLEKILELRFGHKSFRDGQKEIIESVLE